VVCGVVSLLVILVGQTVARTRPNGSLVAAAGGGRVLDRAGLSGGPPDASRLQSALAAAPGHLVTYAQLLRTAWGPSYGRESNDLRVDANQLRRKLKPEAGHPRYVITEPGIGYRVMV
jgi:DNA-binding response OmpR family regulator